MKKIILTAVFAVLAASSVVKAEEIKIDFDGKTAKAASVVVADNIKIDFNIKKSGAAFMRPPSRKEGAAPEEAAAIVPARAQADEFFSPRVMFVLDAAIKSAIEYCDAQGDKVLKAAFEEFLVKATPQQKYEFVYGSAGVYRMPRFPSNKGVAEWVCTAITKTVCKYVCDPGCVKDCQDIIVDSCKWM